MSSAIISQLRLEIAQYQQNLAKASGEAAKFKQELATKTAGIEEAILGKTQRYQAIINKIREEARGLKAELAQAQSSNKEWGGVNRVNMARFRAQMAEEGDKGGSILGSSLMGGFSRNFAPAALAASVGLAVKGAVSAANDAELRQIRFEVLLGNKTEAQDFMAQLEDLRRRSPVPLKDLEEASQLLLAFGIDAKEVPEALSRIGDVSAAIRAPIGEIADLYGKARVQGTLFAEDINQLTGRGIPVIQEFARVLGVGEDQIKKLGSEGKITFPLLEVAFMNLTREGAKFAGLSERIANSNTGKQDRFWDSLRATGAELGEPVSDVLGVAAEVATAKLQQIRAELRLVQGDLSVFAKTSPEAAAAQKTERAKGSEEAQKKKEAEIRAQFEAQQEERSEKERKDAAEKAAGERTKQEKHLNEMRQRAREISDSMLPDEARVAALKAKLGEIFFDEQLKAGPGMGRSIEALGARAQSLRAEGNQAGEKATLQNLQDALSLQKEIVSLQERISNDKAAEVERQRKDQLREQMEIQRIQEELAEEETAARRALLPIEEQLQQIRAEMGRQGAEAEAAMTGERERLEIQREILQLREQERSLVKQIGDQAREAAAEQSALARAKGDYAAQMDILRAEVDGQTELAEQLREEQRIQEEKSRILESQKVSEAEALQMARERVELEKELNAQKERGSQANGGRGNRGRSFNRDSLTRAGFGSVAEMILAEAGGRLPGGGLGGIPGLDIVSGLSRSQPGFPSPDGVWRAGTTLTQQARVNDAAANAPAATTSLEQIVIQTLPQILSELRVS